MSGITQQPSSPPVPGHLRPGAPQRRVVCAANRLTDANWSHVVCASRHLSPLMHSQIAMAVEAGYGTKAQWRTSEQGFIDQWGTFMTREEAYAVAKAAGQLLYTEGLPTTWLDSSHLY